MPYSALAFISIVIFALIHLWAKKTRRFDTITHGRFLSAGGGVAIAYVFVDLLPKLSKSDQVVRAVLSGVFPYFERHVYVMSLAGFLLFFVVDQTQTLLHKKRSFWLSLTSYAQFNFLVGYAVVDKNDPEVRPLALFTFAMGLHYFVNDYSLRKAHGKAYEQTGKWLLIASLFSGWLTGLWFVLPQAAVALISAFIGGGVIMNVTRHELPKENPHSLGAFILAAIVYMIILLTLG